MINNGFLKYLINYLSENNREVLLYDSDNQKVQTERLLTNRANEAAEIFETASLNGRSAGEALELSHNYLKEGWGVSKYQIIEDSLSSIDDKILLNLESEGKKDKFIMLLIKSCSPIFERYDLNIDTFSDSILYEKLESEIKKTLTLFIKDFNKK